eukprot:335106-Amorphochlora_amoeboformis.AAC.1
MEKECVSCSNENSFMDEDGNTCASYSTKKWCLNGKASKGFELKVNKKYQHLSAAEACCVCGGGRHRGTPFEYVVTRAGGVGLIGVPFKAFPRPRTANKYIIDPNCRLANYGLTIDPNTGVISGIPTGEDPLDLTCIITARSHKIGYQESILNGPYREYNATLIVSTKAFALSPSDPVKPAEYQNATLDTIVYDQDSIKKAYKVVWSPKIPVSEKSNLILKCSPHSPFIQIYTQPSAGYKHVYVGLARNLTASQYRELFDSYPGGVRSNNPGASPSGHGRLIKSVCHMSATDATGFVYHLGIKLFMYPPRNKSVDFAPTSALRVTIGQPVINKLELGYPYNSGKKVAPIPGLFGVTADCTSSVSKELVYDPITGSVLME